MSFASNIKAELCRSANKNICCDKAECYGVWLFSKAFERPCVTDNLSVARRMLELAAAVGIIAQISYNISRKKKKAYCITIPEGYEEVGIAEIFGYGKDEAEINNGILKKSCCCGAFLRGVFLACGMASDPEKEYRLEFSPLRESLTLALRDFITSIGGLGVIPSVSQRKGRYFLYVKGSTQIEDLLIFMGARNAAMELMQVKMYKEMVNNINRTSNFETANMDKTYSASAKQTAAIALIIDKRRFENIPDTLREVGYARLENPELSLRELAEILGISRSTVNSRLNKLVKLAQSINGGEWEIDEEKNS